MVFKLPSVRSLSKARSEGDLSENIANADMSASVTEISVSLRRASGMVAKPLRTKRKRASAERCLRPLGATIAMTTPDRKTSNCSGEGRIVACRFTKSQPGGHGDYWVSSPSGNCCSWPEDTQFTRVVLEVEDNVCAVCGAALHLCDHRRHRIFTLQGPVEVVCK